MPAPCQRNKKPLYYVNTFRKYKGFCVNEQRGGAGIAALYASLLTARVSRAAILKLCPPLPSSCPFTKVLALCGHIQKIQKLL